MSAPQKVDLSADSSQLVSNVEKAADSLHNISRQTKTAKEKLNKISVAAEDTAQCARASQEGQSPPPLLSGGGTVTPLKEGQSPL